MLKKIYVYEIFEGDKGIIIASTYEKAEKILKKQYDIGVAKDEDSYWDRTGASLYEVGNVKNNQLHVLFEY